MADGTAQVTAISKDAMLNGLAPMRLPVEAPGGLWAELLLCFAVGLLAGLALDLLLHRRGQARLSLRDRLAALTGLGAEQRRLGLLYLLHEYRPGVLRRWGDRLYRRGGLPDADEIEAELRRHD